MDELRELFFYICNKQRNCAGSPSCGTFCNHTTDYEYAKNFKLINHTAILFGVGVAKELYFEKDLSYIFENPPTIAYKEKEED